MLIIYRPVLLRIRNISGEAHRQNENTHFLLSNVFFYPEGLAVYEIMWKNSVELYRPWTTIWRMRIACWMAIDNMGHAHWMLTKATNIITICNTHCFSLQKWLHECAWMSRCTLPFFFVMKYPFYRDVMLSHWVTQLHGVRSGKNG